MTPNIDTWRRRAGAFFTDHLFRGIAAAGRLHPKADPSAHGVEVLRDIPYGDPARPQHKLDVYRPSPSWSRRGHGATPLRPVVLYVHGGGFRILSKDTHWVMGLVFAREGYVVFNIDYRLAPEHPFPAAIADVCTAYRWVAENAATYGGDPSRIVIAGESAGANLVTALAVATSYERPEPFARLAFEAPHRPIAAMPACGILQVSDPERFGRRRKIPLFLYDRITEVSAAYLGAADPHSPGGTELADPLCILERGERPARPLPPFFAPVGTADPLLDDTRRLAAALERLGTPCEARYYEGEVHAFHAFVFREPARRCWADTFAFANPIVAG